MVAFECVRGFSRMFFLFEVVGRLADQIANKKRFGKGVVRWEGSIDCKSCFWFQASNRELDGRNTMEKEDARSTNNDR
jgi:hypothetical protein